MKMQGKVLAPPEPEVIVVPRSNGDNLIFQAGAVLDYAFFDENIKQPVPPRVIRPGQPEGLPDEKDPKYVAAVTDFGKKRFHYMILKSLESTPGLEWETVNMADSETWSNYESELKASGFTNIEINRIIGGVMTAQGLDDDRIREARESFFASRLKQ